MPPQLSVPGILSLAQAQTGSSITRLQIFITNVPSLTAEWLYAMWNGAILRGFCQACMPRRITGPGFWNRQRGFQAWRNLALEAFSVLGPRTQGLEEAIGPTACTAGVPATEPSESPISLGELFCTEFGHSGQDSQPRRLRP